MIFNNKCHARRSEKRAPIGIDAQQGADDGGRLAPVWNSTFSLGIYLPIYLSIYLKLFSCACP